jgi:hypothetical protein
MPMHGTHICQSIARSVVAVVVTETSHQVEKWRSGEVDKWKVESGKWKSELVSA